MQADFHDARDRHWHDAEKLRADDRLANADHLYGLAAECGLKRLMAAFGMTLRDDGSPANDADRKHADRLWAQDDAYRAGHPNAAAYTLAAQNSFSDWRVEQRHANQTAFNATRVGAHCVAAGLVRKLVHKARLDGLIS